MPNLDGRKHTVATPNHTDVRLVYSTGSSKALKRPVNPVVSKVKAAEMKRKGVK